MSERLVLIRHGRTEWSSDGRHTGRTDIPLTDIGRSEAVLAGRTLAGWPIDHVWSSPLKRSLETATLAGFEQPFVDDDLMEWDYGAIEGMSHDEYVVEHPGWSKWSDELPGGEPLSAVGSRADRVIDRLLGLDGTVVVFSHGHFLAILIARWLGLDPAEGRRFPIETATASLLGFKRDDRVLRAFNHRCGDVLELR